MPTRERRVRKMRGSRTHGWGVSGQHRDGGMRGGRGRTGRFTHKRSKVLAEGIELGKHGFVSHPIRVIRTINLSDLGGLIPDCPEEKSKDELPLIDLTKLGYGKLLGKGTLERPVEVRVAKASKSAVRKIEKAGGRLIRSE